MCLVSSGDLPLFIGAPLLNRDLPRKFREPWHRRGTSEQYTNANEDRLGMMLDLAAADEGGQGEGCIWGTGGG